MDRHAHEGHRVQSSLFPMTAVRGRHPDDLNQGLPEHYDAVHLSRSRHSFEWWHFLKPPKLERLHGADAT